MIQSSPYSLSKEQQKQRYQFFLVLFLHPASYWNWLSPSQMSCVSQIQSGEKSLCRSRRTLQSKCLIGKATIESWAQCACHAWQLESWTSHGYEGVMNYVVWWHNYLPFIPSLLMISTAYKLQSEILKEILIPVLRVLRCLSCCSRKTLHVYVVWSLHPGLQFPFPLLHWAQCPHQGISASWATALWLQNSR